MKVERLSLPDVLLLQTPKYEDTRGFFSETYNQKIFEKAGLDFGWVQDNHSLSGPQYTLRGLHFQRPPFAQDKLVRCMSGSILDVAVDIRAGSPTFGQYVSAVISAENWTQILVPKGFAHGFLTLEPDTQVIYKVTNFYNKASDGCILWNDPAIGIDWAVDSESVFLSDKDRAANVLSLTDTGFIY